MLKCGVKQVASIIKKKRIMIFSPCEMLVLFSFENLLIHKHITKWMITGAYVQSSNRESVSKIFKRKKSEVQESPLQLYL